MTEQTAPATETVEKKRSVWKPLAAAGIGGAVLVATGFGVFAQLSATATNAPLAVTSGDLTLNLASSTGSFGFTNAVSDLAPGDTVNRFVTLTNSGTIAGKDLTLNVADLATPATILTTSASRGLTVALSYCADQWVRPADGSAATCANGQSTVVSTVPVANFANASTAQMPITVPAAALGRGGVSYLRASISLPEPTNTENTASTPSGTTRTLLVAGTPSPIATADSIQGKAASLRFTFTEVQRLGTNTNS